MRLIVAVVYNSVHPADLCPHMWSSFYVLSLKIIPKPTTTTTITTTFNNNLRLLVATDRDQPDAFIYLLNFVIQRHMPICPAVISFTDHFNKSFLGQLC